MPRPNGCVTGGTAAWIAAAIVAAAAPAAAGDGGPPKAPAPAPGDTTALVVDSTGAVLEGVRLTILVGHRMYPNFHETIATTLHRREQIGDTDFFFEAEAFYPTFAIVSRDSTNRVVSLSPEPDNPAVRIRVYRDDDPVEKTWAFHRAKVPHYARTSFLTFRLAAFEYRGTTYGNTEHGEGTR